MRSRGCVVRIRLSVTTSVGLMIDGYETPRGPRWIQISAREIGTGMSDPPGGLVVHVKTNLYSILRPPSTREKFQSLAPFSSEVAPRLERKGWCTASGSPWLALSRITVSPIVTPQDETPSVIRIPNLESPQQLVFNTLAVATSACAFNYSAA